MKHRMQQSLNDLEMHGKNSLFVGGRDGIGLMKAEAPAGPEDLSAKKAGTGEIKGYSRAPTPFQSSSRPREWAGKQEDWNKVGALLYPFIFPVLAFFALRSSGPAGASAFVSLCRPCQQQRVSFFHAFLSHLDSAALCVSFCDTLIS